METTYYAEQSTFVDRAQAETFIGATIVANNSIIEKWLKSGSRKQIGISLEFDEPVGRLIKTDGNEPFEVRGVRVILKPDKNQESGYSIFTAYPIDETIMTTQKIKRKYPQLSALFSTYFNSDWEEDHETVNSVLVDFMYKCSQKELLDVDAEIENLKREFSTKDALRDGIHNNLELRYGLWLDQLGVSGEEWLDCVKSAAIEEFILRYSPFSRSTKLKVKFHKFKLKILSYFGFVA